MIWLLFILGLCSILLGIERAWRFRNSPATLTQKSITAVLFAVGVAAPAYSFTSHESALYVYTQTVWHITICMLIGALELVFLTLRVEHVPQRTIRRIIAQSTLMAVLLLIFQREAMSRRIPSVGIESPNEHDPASIIYLIAFPVYIIWALTQPVIASLPRIPKDFRRRPINTAALLAVNIGFIGFIAVNVALSIMLNTGRGEMKDEIIAFSPFLLAVCVLGAALLAGGERLSDELTARYQLTRISPLWKRMIELSHDGLHLPGGRLSAPEQLQRAYVEISDAISTLRLDTGGAYDIGTVAATLRRGDTTQDQAAPTLSEALPDRATRREDLEMIHAMAKAYRDQ